ncbi:hypothetical protein MHBO_000051 [Bonamia ostreae]|uniref:Uncharacterized protein n=1 Tax=Bonamia ostreae TaxID=126728 RepID=A0ABV2AE65_9EUKA
MFFIFKCLLCVAASDGCGEFKEEGYRILFCDENNPNVCAVGCDEEYYPAVQRLCLEMAF